MKTNPRATPVLKGLEDEEESTKKTIRKRLEWEEANIVRNDHFFQEIYP